MDNIATASQYLESLKATEPGLLQWVAESIKREVEAGGLLSLEKQASIVLSFRAEREAEKVSRARPDGTLADSDLVYAAFARCDCGAGMAYRKDSGVRGQWECSDILAGRAIRRGQPGAKTHTDPLPFAFYEVKSEQQPSANGSTTRPKKVE